MAAPQSLHAALFFFCMQGYRYRFHYRKLLHNSNKEQFMTLLKLSQSWAWCICCMLDLIFVTWFQEAERKTVLCRPLSLNSSIKYAVCQLCCYLHPPTLPPHAHTLFTVVPLMFVADWKMNCCHEAQTKERKYPHTYIHVAVRLLLQHDSIKACMLPHSSVFWLSVHACLFVCWAEKLCCSWPLVLKCVCFHDGVPFMHKHLRSTELSGGISEWSQLVCAERKTDESEKTWSTGTQWRTMAVWPSCQQSSVCVCVCLSEYISRLFCWTCLCSSANLRKKQKKRRWEKGQRRDKDEREEATSAASVTSRFKVYQKEKDGSSFGPGEGYCWRGVGTDCRKTATERKMCVFSGCLWPCSCLVYVCVCVCGWTLSSVSRKRGEPSEGWTGNSNRANFL